MIKFPIYLDNHATTKPDPRVVETMMPYMTENYGNAASRAHSFGWKAEAAVELARKQVAELIGADKKEIIFTSGATESINLAIKGIAEANSEKGKTIISVSTEHRASLDTIISLEKNGFKIVYLNVDRYGVINLNELSDKIEYSTILVSVMTANNEIGTINDIDSIAKICSEKGVLFHTDAVQAAGKIPLDVNKTRIDLMSISAHKMYGPKGIGALFVRSKFPKIKIKAQIDGGGHEKGMRSGTLNVPAIAGFGRACEICLKEMEGESRAVKNLRDKLETGIKSQLDDVIINGHPQFRLYNNSNISFPGITADALIMSIREIAVSSGSACTSASEHPSHVLKAIGLRDELVKSSIRFGLGRYNTEEEIDYVINKVTKKVNYLRSNSAAGKTKLKMNV